MGPDHPDAFIDFPSVEAKRAAWDELQNHAPLGVCPVCKGHGGWNLKLNNYRLRPDMADTPENRHKHSHFRSSCSQCNGWGFVDNQLDLNCVHTMVRVRHDNVRCLSDYRCSKGCGCEYQIDSSD